MQQDPTVWARRPLPEPLVDYAAADALCLLSAGKALRHLIDPTDRSMVIAASSIRCDHCQAAPALARRRRVDFVNRQLSSWELASTTDEMGRVHAPAWESTHHLLPAMLDVEDDYGELVSGVLQTMANNQ